MGHNVFSLQGVYQNSPEGTLIRGSIPNLYQNEHLKSVALQCNKENIHPELLDWADIVIMTHNSRVDINDHPQPWLNGNWDRLKKSKKPVIWRSIGQSSQQIEEALKKFRKEGLKIVRYSPTEETIPDYQGSDSLIRFYADPQALDGYTGITPRIVNISQAMFGGPNAKSRGDHMNLAEFKQIIDGLDWKIFGRDNENAGEHNGGVLSYEDLKAMMRFNRAYLYTGTRPAPYTLAFMEAFMLGIPIISIGPKMGNSIYTNQRTFEVPEIIGPTGDAGFWADNIGQLREYCTTLINDSDLARSVGERGRIKAIQIFGKEKIKREWEMFFKSL